MKKKKPLDTPLKKILDREADWLSAQTGVHSLGIQQNDKNKPAIAIYCDMGTTPIMFVPGQRPKLERIKK